MRLSHVRRLVLAALLVLAGPWGGPAAAAEKPRLVVLLVVDQMRADYVDWYGARWRGGLRRLYDQGAVMTNARYPYLATLTCPGHFTLSTGAFPHRHGMVSNAWFDRAQGRGVDCTDDPRASVRLHPAQPTPAPPPPGTPPQGDSARNNRVPTLADEVQRLRPRGQVVALSVKARSAIGVAGKGRGVVLWTEAGRWATSTAFAPAMPPWVQRFLDQLPPAQANDPVLDDHLARLASLAVTELKLGQGRATDYLGISFSITDLIGHRHGPRSAQVQEVLARLDTSLGQLLESLDRAVGPQGYVLALSADHGVAEVPEEAQKAGQDAGRLVPSDLLVRAEAILAAELGGRDLVKATPGNDIYLATGVHRRLTTKPGAMARVLAALKTIPGVADAFDSRELTDPRKAADPLRRAAALGYYPGRSGDLVLVHKPGWVVGGTGTNHGSFQDYDRHVPVIFFGRGVKPGRYPREITPADVAPTLGRLIGVTLRQAQGSVITEVISPAP